MHSYAHGLGGKHFWPLLQEYIHELGRLAAGKVDEQCVHVFTFGSYLIVSLRIGELPRWRNLNHFNEIMNIHFADVNKFEDILNVCPNFHIVFCIPYLCTSR